MSKSTPLDVLSQCHVKGYESLDLSAVCVAFAALDHDTISSDRYHNHLKKLAGKVKNKHADFIKAGAEDNAGTQLAALKEIIVGDEGYTLRAPNPEAIHLPSFIDAINDRAGPDLFLALLYICVADQLQWDVHGLNIPGCFITRVEKDGDRLIFDPAQDCRPLQAYNIRNRIKKVRGEKAEISAEYFNPLSKYDVVMAIQNHIKHQKIRAEDYAGALKTVQAMQAFAPDEYRLLLDAGVLYSKTDNVESAIFALENYISKAPNARDRHDALMILNELRGQ